MSPSPSAQPAPSATPPAADPSATDGSRADREPAAQEYTDRPVWPWLLTAGLVLGGLVVLLRSLRRRRR